MCESMEPLRVLEAPLLGPGRDWGRGLTDHVHWTMLTAAARVA